MDLQDRAFNYEGWAYLTGRHGRKPRGIVRYLNDGVRADSKLAGQTLSLPMDSSNTWTRQERTITEVYRSELGVVVGELLPTDVDTSMATKTRWSSEFDPSIHDAVHTAPANQVAIVIKKLDDAECNLYILYGEYQGGLRKIAQLPNEGDIWKRIVYYPEWTVNVYKAQHGQRRAAYHKIIADFSKAYIEDHMDDFLDTVQASDLKGDPMMSPIDTIVSKIRLGIATWEHTGNPEIITLIREEVRDALGNIDWSEFHSDSTDIYQNLSLIRIMFESRDSFDQEQAAETAEACEALWQDRIEPRVISDLALGIRAGALGDTPIAERLYRALIACFCDIHRHQEENANQDMHANIRRAYELAIKVGGDPRGIQEPSSTNSDGSTNVIILDTVIETISSMVKAMKRRLAVERNEHKAAFANSVDDIPTLLKSISTTFDAGHTRDVLERIANASYLVADCFVQQTVTMLTQFLADLRRARDFMGAESEDEEGAESEDEEGADESDGGDGHEMMDDDAL